MQINKTLSIALLSLAVLSILLLNYVPNYYTHLRVDIYGQYLNHAKSFLNNHNLSSIGNNEYQPVAVMLFVSLSPSLLKPGDQVSNYISALFTANILFIALAAFLIYKFTKSYDNIFIFALVLLFTGPIILNRFEMLVFVLILSGLIFFKAEKFVLAGAFMSVAILTKIYPFLFIPYFFYILLKNKSGIKKIRELFFGYAIGAATILFWYCGILGASFSKILGDLSVHSIKPVHAESVWATLITMIQWPLNNMHAIGGGLNGIYGIRSEFIYLPLWFYNYFWILPIAVFYALFFFKTRSRERISLDPAGLVAISLIFLASSKILTPQYLLWFALLFCLQKVPGEKFNERLWSISLTLILLTLLLSQFIYPLNYDRFINFYQGDPGSQHMYWLMALRNISLIFLAILSSFWFLSRKNEPALNNN